MLMQVFYVDDSHPEYKRWHVVLSGKRHIVGVENVTDEDVYDYVNDIPPFLSGIEPLSNEDDEDDTIYLRDDHEEGIWENIT